MKLLHFLFGTKKKEVLREIKPTNSDDQSENHPEEKNESESMFNFTYDERQYFLKHKDIFETISEKLKLEKIDIGMSGYNIEYKTGDGDIHKIDFDDVSVSENKIAWFQTSFHDHHLLRVFENNDSFNWEPLTHNPVFGCDCFLIEWLGEHLIFIYKEKHNTYICSIKNKNLKTVHFHGEEIEKENDIIYLGEYGRREYIRRIRIPDLVELEPELLEELKKRNLQPKDGYGKNFRNK